LTPGSQRRRPAIDKINVKELAKAGHLTYREISQRLDLPFGTVTRYLNDLRKTGDVPRRAPGAAVIRGVVIDG